MANNIEPKKYGLILSKQKSTLPKGRSKLSAFTDHASDSSDEDKKRKSKKAVGQEDKVKRHVQSQIEQALREDPTVFEYDSVFDEMEREKSSKFEKKREKDQKREPKYIKNLLKAAQLRQREYDAREDRKQALEREKEGSEFDDKEVFVTSTYRQKMEELESYKEEEKRKEYIESVMNVTRQKDISGFYKHLLNDMTEPSESVKPVKECFNGDEKSETEFDHGRMPRSGKKTPKEERLSDEDIVEEAEPNIKRKKTPRKESSRNETEEHSTATEREKEKVRRKKPDRTEEVSAQESRRNAEKRPAMTEQEEKERLVKKRLENLRKLLARQNDKAQIDQYRQRYLERKAQKS